MTNQYEEILKIDGPRKGPIVSILAGVHGDEQPGIIAMKKIAPQLRLKKGTVYMIYGNPKAILLSQRETDQNLNRMFRDNIPKEIRNSYEYNRAQLIKKYLDKSDICLDLHASTSDRTEVFGITEEKGLDLAKWLPIEKILLNIDQFHPGSTDGYMNNIGKIGICIECGNKRNAEASTIAELSINNLLSRLSMIENQSQTTENKLKLYLSTDIYLNISDSFRLDKNFADFEDIPPNSIIGEDNRQKVTFSEEFSILFARNANRKGEECFLRTKRL